MTNPYKLPDGNVQISFSGGRTSAYMLHEIMVANDGLPDRAVVTFANTGREMPETLDFVHDCSVQWDVPIVWLEYDRPDGKAGYKVVGENSASRDGEPFETLLKQKKYLPNVVTRFCTTELKIRPMKRYLTKELGWKNWSACVGIRADERHRAKTDSKDRWTYWYPLLDAGVSKMDVNEFWSKSWFDLRLNNAAGSTPKGNCDFCFLKSEATLAAMAKQHPERAEWWMRMEQECGSTFRKGRNLNEFVDFVQRQQDWIFDEEGFFCQADDGECTG
jgi:3'-phosphoadenosine 5'-phosphosulfate sulfotransferase (PAPS reductase)/FAD synthetase